MAAAIVIRGQLEQSDIDRAFAHLEKRGKEAFGRLNQYAQETAKKFGDALGGGNVNQALSKMRQLRETINALDAAAAAQHQRKLAEIDERGIQVRNAIALRRQAQLDQMRAREQQSEQRHQQKIVEIHQRSQQVQTASLDRYGQQLQRAGLLLTGLSAGVVGLGAAAVKSAIDIDKNVNVLRAFTGSAEAAEKRLAQLIATAQKTPGLTTGLALTLDAQLRAARVAEQTIDRLLPAIGRINAVSALPDPSRFVNNLVQLITQNFERQDLKELVGQSPIAGNLIRQLFNVDNPTNAKAIKEAAKRMGITTVDEFFKQFADAAAKSPELQRAQESLGTQFDKLRDRALVALRPLGLEIINTLRPAVERAIPLIESLSKNFAALPQPVREAVVAVGALTIALGPLLLATGTLVQGATGLAALIGLLRGTAVATAATAASATTAAAGFAAFAAGITSANAVAAASIPTWAALGARIIPVVAALAAFSQVGDVSGRTRQLANEADRRVQDLAARQARFPVGVTPLGGPNLNDPSVAFSLLQPGAAKPPPLPRFGGGGGGDSEAKRAAAEARRIREARLTELRQSLQEELREYQQHATSANQTLIDSYREQEITTREFLENRRLITEGEIEKIIQIRNRESVAILDALKRTKPGTEDNIRLNRELDEVYSKATVSVEKLREALAHKVAQDRIDLANSERKLAIAREEFALRNNLRFGGSSLTDEQERVIDPRVFAGKRAESLFNIRDLQSRQQEVAIQNQVNLGLLTEVEGRTAILALQRQSRDEMIQLLEIQKQAEFAKGIEGSAEAVEQLNLQIEQLRTLGVELDNGQRFVRGFGSQIETVGDIFERFGSNVARALTNVKDLKRAVLDFFNDILGNALQNLLRGTFNSLGNLLGGGGGGFNLGNLFRTPGFNPASGGGGGAFNFGSLASIFTGGLNAPASITSRIGATSGALSGLRFSGGGGLLSGFGGISGGSVFGGGGGGFFGNLFGGFQNLFGGGGGASLGLSFLGAGLGSLLGRGSTAGSILSGIGGALIASGPGAIFGVPLLIAGALLGRSARRRADERTSGDYLQDAVNKIKALRKDVVADRVVGESEARKIFNDEILQAFIDQINTIKTKSVRESRLRNQTADLKALFEKEVIPAIIEQATRRVVAEKLIPEFATGGFKAGTGLALLHDREVILNRNQQAALRAATSPNIFQQIGVPNVPSAGPFETGGVYRAPAGGSRADDQPLVVNITLGLTDDFAEGITVKGISTNNGRRAVVGAVRSAEVRARG